MLKVVVVETQRQPIGIIVTQSFDVGITTTRVEMVVVPTIDVAKKGVLIGSATKLGSGLGGVSARRKLNGILTLPTSTTRVVGTPQMVFTNLIINTHVNRIANRPPMSSMVDGGCRSVNSTYLKGGYQEPFVVIAPISNHKDGHYVRPNKVAFK